MALVKKCWNKWKGKFGKEYTDRSYLNVAQLDKLYVRTFGISAKESMGIFFNTLSRSLKILEVGCNVGNQLMLLEAMGFKCLYGIDVNPYAVAKAKKRLPGAQIIQGAADDIPFKDGYFDLVMTCGVLIHIPPGNLPFALREIHRCSNKYIFGYEYYSPQYKEVAYRGNKKLLWKGDFKAIYKESSPGLALMKHRYLPYLGSENTDEMFLLRKSAALKKAIRPEAQFVIHEPTLQGKNISLVGLSPRFISERYARWFNDKEVCKFNRHGQKPYTVSDLRDYVSSADKSSAAAVFAIVTKEGNQHVGNISLTVSWEQNSGEIAIIIGEKEYWGKGIATEAYRMIIDYGFKVLHLHRIWSGMVKENKGMVSVAGKAGMQKEGIMKDAFYKEAIYHDIIRYAVLNPKH
jgi:pseudaminic acid biosynthesis-associated methylase